MSEIRPGMRGYGRTVFSGVKIETFAVKVLGVLPKENLGRPLILVRMDGGPISKRAANIIGGMSGSPVYINGRLVGAVAYGQTFPREPIAMLTPIEDMLDSLDPALQKKPEPKALPKQARLSAPVRVGNQVYDRVRFRSEPYQVARVDKPQAGTLEMAPIATPAMVAGVSARSMDRLAEVFRPYGVEPMAGPGGLKYDKPIPLVPGSAVGASLVTGDVDMTATGTLTYRKGNQVLAFGHPFMQMGPVDFPLTTAWVHDVFPSIQRSFKIASPVSIVGSILQDRPWGIGGVVGHMPDLIPVEASVRDFGTGRRKTLHAKVIENRFMTGQLLAMVANEAIMRVHSVPGDATAHVTTEIQTEELGNLRRDNTYYDPAGIDATSLGDLLTGIGLLSNNPWQQVNIKGVKVSVDIDGARRTAVIERAVADKEKYEPGDTVQVQVTLRPWEKEPVQRTLSIKIPEYAPDGRVSLRIAGGAGLGAMLVPQGPDAGGQPGSASPMLRLGPSPMAPATSLKQLVQNYLEKERNSDLVAKLSLPTYTANIEGQKMRTVPPTLLDVLRSPRNSGVRMQNDEVKASEITPWVISGAAAVSLAIERRTFGEKPGPSGPRTVPSAPPTPPTDAGPRAAMDSDFDSDDLGASVSTLPAGLGGWVQNSVGRQPAATEAGFPIPTAAAVAAAVNADAPAMPAAAAKAPEGNDTSMPPTPAGAAAAQPPANPSGSDASSTKKPEVESGPTRAAGRAPVVWKQNTAAAFERGRLVGVSTTSRGELTLARTLEKVRSLDASYIWSALSANGATYVGTGDKGTLYRLQGDTATPLLKTDELQILALARDAAGNLYAGTAPHGLVYRIAADGKSSIFWRSKEEYILSLAVDGRGNVYAGTSPEGRVYRITPDGQGSLLATVPDPYVVSLVAVGDAVYAGAGQSAGVYRIAADGKVSTVFDPAEGNTASVLATDRQGRLYIGTSPKGSVLRVDGNGKIRILLERTTPTPGSPAGITALGVDSRGIVWATAGTSVYRIEDDADEPSVEKIDNQNGPRFLTMALDEQGNIALGTATGDLYRLSTATAQRGELESAVRDAGSVARWGRISWIARTPAGTGVALQTRTGNSEEPDATWSAWSEEMVSPGKSVASPAARYLQYRVHLIGGKGDDRPVLTEVSLTYMPRNQAPKLTVAAPRGGEVWSRKQTIRWSGTDADQDTLLYDVYYSRDNGATWTRMERVVKEGTPPVPSGPGPRSLESPGATDKPKAPAEGQPASVGAAQKSGAATVLNITGSHLISSAKPAGLAPDASDAAKTPEAPKRRSDSMKETSLSWDTAEVSDGQYLIKIVASDRLSNPTDSYSIERIVGPIEVCNTAPKVALQGEPTVGGDRTVHVAGKATSTVPLSGVDYRVDEGEWTSAAPTDGIFDSEAESFEFSTPALEAGERTLELRVVDAGGNVTKETRKVTVR